MVSDELYMAIGGMTMSAARAEERSRQLLWECLGLAGEVAVRLTWRQPWQRTVRLVREMSDLEELAGFREPLRSWAKDADAVRNRRNEVIHSVVVVDVYSDRYQDTYGSDPVFKSWTKDGEARVAPAHVEDVRGIGRQLEEVGLQALALTEYIRDMRGGG